MKFQICGSLVVDDYYRFKRTYLKDQVAGGMKKYIYMLIGIWMIAIFVMNFIWAFRDGESPFNVMFFSFIAFVLTQYYLIYGYYFSKKSLRRLFSSDKALSEHQRMKIDEHGIEIRGESFSVTLSRDNIIRVLHDDNAFYVFMSKRQAYLFPSRYFSDENEFACCRDFVVEKFGAGRK